MNLESFLKALANGGGNTVYSGEIKYTKKVLWLLPLVATITSRNYAAPSGLLPFDSYPGSFIQLKFDNSPSTVSRDDIFSYDNTFNIQRRFSYTHTTSSLDIGSGAIAIGNAQYNTRYIGAAPPIAPYDTPFDNFITAFNTNGAAGPFYNQTTRVLNNEPHAQLFLRNANWLANELNQIIPSANCSFLCSNTTYTISGAPTLCNSALNYTLNNPPAGSTITWLASPAGIVTIQGSGPQVTVTKINAGFFTLTAKIEYPGCGELNVTSATFRAGGYGSGDYPVSGPSSACKNTYINFSTITLPGATSYNWFWPNGWTNATGQGTPNLSVRTNTTSGPVGVRVANACDAGGSAATRFVQVNTTCGSSFIISSNPSTDNITLVATEQSIADASNSPGHDYKFYKIKIIDQSGNIKKQFNYSAGIHTINISVSNLIPGIYTAQVFNGKDWISQNFIKQ